MGSDTTMRGVLLIRRTLVLPVKICYRSVCNHPFLAALVCFLAVLYRSFPLLFSLLVSASPVLVCTAVLLGTLLSFGELNIPEVEIEREGEELADEVEEEISHVISSLRAAQAVDGIDVTQREGNLGLEKLVETRRELSPGIMEDDNLTEDDFSKIGQDDSVPDYMPLINENSPGEQHEEGLIEESETRVDHDLFKKIREVMEDKVGKKEEFGNFRVSGIDGDPPAEPSDSQKNNHMDFQVDWKQVKKDIDEEKKQDEEASDSESDRAESSSPDASMADIIPMLDELHPLLDEEDPLLAERSFEGSEAGSETSGRSEESSIESDDDTEDQGEEEEDGIDENDHGEEEEVQGSKDDESKSAIKWTEDDQKNLVDLGSLELERNQRLESLIARRRARRNMRLMTERNLIDLDGADIPVNMPPISTTRQNPFDLPYDPFDDVPGSAPSIMLQRKNPFDLPYEPNEEKPDLKGDSFQQEFSAPSQREPVFRRHESFSVGPSGLGFPRHERQDLRWKPYFVPDRFAGEGTSESTFQRQLSEASESKLSLVQDTESASSVVEDEEIDEEEKKVNEEDVAPERETILVDDHVSLLVERGSFTSEDAATMDVEEAARNVQHNDDEVNTLSGDVEHRHETDSTLSASGEMTPVEHNASEILMRMGLNEEEYSSESIISSPSDTDENISGVNQGSATLQESTNQVSKSYISSKSLVESKSNFVADHKAGSDILKQGSLESQLHNRSWTAEDNYQHMHPVMETMPNHIGELHEIEQPAIKLEGDHVSTSCSPKQRSLEAESRYLSEAESDNDEFGTSGQTPLESDCDASGAVVGDSHHRDPVYDSSPASSDRFLSFRSVSSDTLRDILELSSPPALADPPGIKSDLQPDIADKDSSRYKEIGEGYSLQEMEVRLPENAELSENDLYYDIQNGSTNAEPIVEHASVTLHSLATDEESSKEGGVHKEQVYFHEGNQIQSSNRSLVETLDSSSSNHLLPKVAVSPGSEEHPEQEMTQSPGLDPIAHVDAFKSEESISRVSISDHMHPNGTTISRREEGWPTEVANITNQDNAPSETIHVGENSSRKEEAPKFGNNHARIPTSDVRTDIVDPYVYKEVVYAKEKSAHRLEKWYSWSDKSMVESSDDIHILNSEPSSNHAAEVGEVSINEKTSTPEAEDYEDTVSVAPVNSDFTGQPPDGADCSSSSLREDIKESTLDKIVYETNTGAREHSNDPSESYESFSAEEDEIKEIDEKLLSELETVGDFCVKEVVGESTQDEKMAERSVIGQPEVDGLPGIPVLQVKTVEDVEFALEQLHKRENAEEVISRSVTENKPVSDDSRGLSEPISDSPTNEASSLEDVDIAMNQDSEGDIKEQQEILYSKEGVLRENEENLLEQHQVHETSALADANEAPKQISEAIGIPEAVPGRIGNQMVVDESEDTVRTSSDMTVVEADAEAAPKQLSESNIAAQPRSPDTMDEPHELRESISVQEIVLQDEEHITLEAKEADSTNGVGLINEHPVTPDAIDFHEVKPVVEVTSPSSNKNSNGLNSSSSSSSSSSSNDSRTE